MAAIAAPIAGAGSLLCVIMVVFAVIIALQCNRGHAFWYVVLALFFPEIYLAQWVIRKFVLKEVGYCPIAAFDGR